MKNKLLILLAFGLFALTGQAQKNLPRFKYSKEPTVLIGCIVGDSTQKVEDVKLIYTMKYHSGTGDARKGKKAVLDENGCCSFSMHTGTTVVGQVMIGDIEFPCYIVPGDTVVFTLDMGRLKTCGLSQSLSFSGTLADFNHDLVYATEQGFDPETIYREIEKKRNMGNLIDELPQASVDGYFQYLDSTYQKINERIDKDNKIGDAYREFAKTANH